MSLDMRLYQRDMIAPPPPALITELAVTGSPGLAIVHQDLSLIVSVFGGFEVR